MAEKQNVPNIIIKNCIVNKNTEIWIVTLALVNVVTGTKTPQRSKWDLGVAPREGDKKVRRPSHFHTCYAASQHHMVSGSHFESQAIPIPLVSGQQEMTVGKHEPSRGG